MGAPHSTTRKKKAVKNHKSIIQYDINKGESTLGDQTDGKTSQDTSTVAKPSDNEQSNIQFGFNMRYDGGNLLERNNSI